MKKRDQQSWPVALCGMAVAVSVVLMLLGAATTLLNKTAKRVESVYDEEYQIQLAWQFCSAV